jgi:hypothetical protein
MTYECQHCRARLFECERRLGSFCCSGGRVDLPVLEDPPEPLARLLTSDDEDAREFRLHARHYNNVFAMASLHADDEFHPDEGVSEVVINGQVYGRIGGLDPAPRRNRTSGKTRSATRLFGQYYVVDNRESAIEGRLNVTVERTSVRLRRGTAEALLGMLETYNPLVRRFRTAGERMRENPRIYLQLALTTACNKDRRQWNTYGPVEDPDEIGVLVPACEDYSWAPQQRAILLEAVEESGRLQDIPGDHELYEPLLFPLLLPRGERGWRWDILPAGDAVAHGRGWKSKGVPSASLCAILRSTTCRYGPIRPTVGLHDAFRNST